MKPELRALVDRFNRQVEIALKYAHDEKPRHEKAIASVFELQVGHLRDIANDLFASLSHHPSDEGWRSMDSAPRDGTHILLYAAAWSMTWGEVLTGYFDGGEWIVGEGAVSDNETGFDPDAEVDDEDFDFDTNVGPTHWRPLPTPPHPSQVGER